MSEPPSPSDKSPAESHARLISLLPDRVWYLSQTGADMWCRRPYSFFFSTSEAASRFADEMDVDIELSPIGVDTRELLFESGLQAMRMQHVTRIFFDPSIDPESGDVFGTILRLAQMN